MLHAEVSRHCHEVNNKLIPCDIQVVFFKTETVIYREFFLKPTLTQQSALSVTVQQQCLPLYDVES
jgi:hypothetical protein